MHKSLSLIAGTVLLGCVLMLNSSSISADNADFFWDSADTSTGEFPAPQTPAKVHNSAVEQTNQKLILDESFEKGSLDPQIWNTCHWWQDRGCTIGSNDEMQWYVPEQVQLKEGTLQLIAKKQTVQGTDGKQYDYASGMVTTGPPAHDKPAKLAFTFGKVEVKFKIPEGTGLWPAIWLLPASEESRPEIDMLEVLGDDTGRLRMRLHPEDRAEPSVGKQYSLPPGYTLASQWRTVALDWSPGALRMYLDGKLVWALDSELVPDEPMYLVLNLAVGGHYPGPPDANTTFPALFEIDHVWITAHD